MQNTKVIPFPKSRIVKVRKPEKPQILTYDADQSNQLSVTFILWKHTKALYPLIFLVMFLISYYNL